MPPQLQRQPAAHVDAAPPRSFATPGLAQQRRGQISASATGSTCEASVLQRRCFAGLVIHLPLRALCVRRVSVQAAQAPRQLHATIDVHCGSSSCAASPSGGATRLRSSSNAASTARLAPCAACVARCSDAVLARSCDSAFSAPARADAASARRGACMETRPERTVLGARAVQRFAVEGVDARACAAREARVSLPPSPQCDAPARRGARTELELVLRHRHAAHNNRRPRGKRRARRAARAAAPPAAPAVCGARDAAAASAQEHSAAPPARGQRTRAAEAEHAPRGVLPSDGPSLPSSCGVSLYTLSCARARAGQAVSAPRGLRARRDRRDERRTSSSSPSTTAPAGAAYMAAAQLRGA